MRAAKLSHEEGTLRRIGKQSEYITHDKSSFSSPQNIGLHLSKPLSKLTSKKYFMQN